MLEKIKKFVQGYFLYSCLYQNAKSSVSTKIIWILEKSFCPFLGWVGRNSLIIYMLHQPVIYGVLWFITGW